MLAERNIQWTPEKAEKTSVLRDEIGIAGSIMVLSVQTTKKSNGQGEPLTIVSLGPKRR